LESGRPYGGEGVPREMAAPTQPRPKPATVERPLRTSDHAEIGNHVLEEAQLPSRAQHAPQLAKRRGLILDRTEHQRGHGGVKAVGDERRASARPSSTATVLPARRAALIARSRRYGSGSTATISTTSRGYSARLRPSPAPTRARGRQGPAAAPDAPPRSPCIRPVGSTSARNTDARAPALDRVRSVACGQLTRRSTTVTGHRDDVVLRALRTTRPVQSRRSRCVVGRNEPLITPRAGQAGLLPGDPAPLDLGCAAP
jgi:hypothetical protein